MGKGNKTDVCQPKRDDCLIAGVVVCRLLVVSCAFGMNLAGKV